MTDLTYVRVDRRWAYVCLTIDFFNREIIGLTVGWHKTAELVKQAIQSIPYALTKVKLFHSDRGKEFDNQLIDEMLEAFGITRSSVKLVVPMIMPSLKVPIVPSNWSLSTRNLSVVKRISPQNERLCPLVELSSHSW